MCKLISKHKVRKSVQTASSTKRPKATTQRGNKPTRAGNWQFFQDSKKFAKSKIACIIGKKVLKYLPDIYENLSGKIKNKKLKKILDPDSAKKFV